MNRFFVGGSIFLTVMLIAGFANAFSYPVGTSSPRDASGYTDKQNFGVWNDEYDGYHLGEDWNRGGGNDDCGDSIYAVSGGVVVAAGDFGTGWGNIVIVRHGLAGGNKKVESMYAHLDTMSVSTGNIVTWGQQIGTMGGDELCDECTCHLHFEMRNEDCDDFGDDGPGYASPIPSGWFDPSNFIDNNPISVTTFWSNTESSMGPWDLNNEYFHVKARIANGSSSSVNVYRVLIALHDDDNDWVADLYSTIPDITLSSGSTRLIDPPSNVFHTSSFSSGDYQIVVKFQRSNGAAWENLGSRNLSID